MNGAAAPGMANQRLRCLIVEDSEDDALLLQSELTRSSPGAKCLRVDCAADMAAALLESDWDIVISDHSLPRFSSLEALQVLQECGKDIPFIIYSGEVSEHVAVAALHSGAQDSIPKGNVARLVPAIERELHGAAVRRAKDKADAQVRRLAFYDTLTGLPNRNLFCEHVGGRLAQADSFPAAVLVLDLDRFKHVNTGHGVKAGDALIVQIAQRLQACVPDAGMVARLGSDEFAVFLPELLAPAAKDAAVQILRALSPHYQWDALEFFLGASIGIALSSGIDDDVQELLIKAETAMFQVKGTGGGTYRLYEPEMGAAGRQHLELENAMRHAVRRGELLVEYQPTWSVASGKLTGVEALVRWLHPVLGRLAPDAFIPLADETGLINEIGHWVLQTACRQAKVWHDAGHPELNIAVNVSAVQFWQPGLLRSITDVLLATGIDPRRLELEITESVLLRDVEAAIKTLQALRAMHVRISLDDFGTAYSSLSYLQRLPFDILKVDKSFSIDLVLKPGASVILQAVGQMGRALGLVTVAEGVETMVQMKFFQEQGFDRVQGFLFSPPRGVADIDSMLRDEQVAQTCWALAV